MKYRVLSVVLPLVFAASARSQTLPAQISAEDRAKIQVLHDLLLDIQREPTRWQYLVVDQNVSRWNAAAVNSFLDKRGRFGYELVSETELTRHGATRFIFKRKVAKSPDIQK
jgi:hypothetical protein